MKKAMMTGMGTLGVIALMMTMTLKAGAMEKAVESVTEKVELATSVEASTLAVTAEKLIAKWAMEKALRRPEKLEVMEEPVEEPIVSTKRMNTFDEWYTVTFSGGQWHIGTVSGPPTAGTGIGCFLGNSGDYCAIRLTLHESITPTSLEGKTLEEIQILYGSDPETGGVANANEYGRDEEDPGK